MEVYENIGFIFEFFFSLYKQMSKNALLSLAITNVYYVLITVLNGLQTDKLKETTPKSLALEVLWPLSSYTHSKRSIFFRIEMFNCFVEFSHSLSSDFVICPMHQSVYSLDFNSQQFTNIDVKRVVKRHAFCMHKKSVCVSDSDVWLVGRFLDSFITFFIRFMSFADFFFFLFASFSLLASPPFYTGLYAINLNYIDALVSSLHIITSHHPYLYRQTEKERDWCFLVGSQFVSFREIFVHIQFDERISFSLSLSFSFALYLSFGLSNIQNLEEKRTKQCIKEK